MCTWVTIARAVIPANIVIASPPMIVRVAAALRAFGSWKLGTPLLTASTPVRAVQPLAKARSTRKTVSRPPGRWSGTRPEEPGGWAAGGVWGRRSMGVTPSCEVAPCGETKAGEGQQHQDDDHESVGRN